MPSSGPTVRTRVIREPQRAVYDRETCNAILDEGIVCHVGFVADGQPYVIPTSYGRVGDNIYVHGSAASRMLKQLSASVPVCVTVTLVDGLVLARSVFNHSMNYRSVVILGQAILIDDPEEKLAALRALSERIVPGRWNQSRQPNEQELKATSILRIPLTEYSAKIRTGPPEDNAEDHALEVWAGIIPLNLVPAEPIPDPHLRPGIAIPDNVKHYSRAPRS
ncbi:MAG TPA: pyridoxamine 5'-phosphate oxidase family protein [Terriglobales bacterium]|nr:pyridoxamine 5'-phosphate oxidase family protein [Terriglobales bacterium]